MTDRRVAVPCAGILGAAVIGCGGRPPAAVTTVAAVSPPALDGDSVSLRTELVVGSCVPPRYPVGMREIGTSGRVVLSFVVDSTGHAEANSFRVVTATNDEFVQPSIETMRSCRFRPAQQNGRLVRVRVASPVSFRVSP